ncbi:MAG TPA: hypothetical protein EYO72_04485 [Marine Group III euryarchaeote]|nr:hypothetical protein [Marine Group III euryarchaeote]
MQDIWDLYRSYRYIQFMMEERHRIVIFSLSMVLMVILIRWYSVPEFVMMLFWVGFWAGSAMTHSFGDDKTFLSSLFHFGNKTEE